MASHGRLWHVLNAGLRATPTDAVGDKRTRAEAEGSEETPPADQTDSDLEEEDDLSPADISMLDKSMRMKLSITPTWRPEHRDFSHNFEHANVPLVRYNQDWDIPEFRLTDSPAREFDLTGTLDGILLKLEGGSPERPPAFNTTHFSLHLAACQAALYKRPELMNGMEAKFHKYIRADGELLLKLIFVYNAISEETGRDALVYATDLEAMGLSDLEVYRFWHQLRSLLSDLMECTAVSQEDEDSGEPVEVADFVSRMMVELDPRPRVLSYGTQPMDW
jgi:hypothetical protein